MTDQKKTTDERVVAALGADPTKRPKITADILKKVQEKRAKEAAEKAEKNAEELLTLLDQLQNKRHQARQAFKKADEAIEKDIQKTLKTIDAAFAGQEAPAEEEPKEPEQT